jgi:tetratricopeptide (TPR) repeat protein
MLLAALLATPFLFAEQADNYTLRGKKEALASAPASDTGGGFSWQEEENLSEIQKQARLYRNEGFQFQQKGDLDSAMKLYQKATILDPGYAVAYNDLGVIYETRGFTDGAEEYYLKAVKINPNYLSAYTNLAWLYEGKRDLEKAIFYWEKRVKLGSSDDPWTEKARQRLKDLRLVLSKRPFRDAQVEEAMDLLADVAAEKALLRKDNKYLAKNYFEKAKISFKKGDEVTALKLAVDAQQLDPSNDEIKEFIEKIQARVLSK